MQSVLNLFVYSGYAIAITHSIDMDTRENSIVYIMKRRDDYEDCILLEVYEGGSIRIHMDADELNMRCVIDDKFSEVLSSKIGDGKDIVCASREMMQ
jgi:hypothetical protein